MARSRDSLTFDLFPCAPRPLGRRAGSLNVTIELRHLLSAVLKRTVLSRYQVAARMSELIGADITKHQLDSWTAESRDGWRFPLEYLLAFEEACETHEVTAFIAERRGCRMLVGQEALLADLGRIEQMQAELREQRQWIKKRLGEGEK